MPTAETLPNNLPEDKALLKALLRSLLAERDPEKERAGKQAKRADDLYLENLRLERELARYKKWYYGPRADRLRSEGELAQALLNFAEELERKPIPPDDAACTMEPVCELRRVERRRHLASFETLPVTTPHRGRDG